MERFRPDSWWEGALRPFLMADPEGWLYVEMSAPDWRFAILAVFLLAAFITERGKLALPSTQLRALLALVVSMYVWTFVSGNGRYFLPGLLLVGPVIVVAVRRLPGTQTFRLLLLGVVVAMQALTVSVFFHGDQWGIAKWREGAVIPLPDSLIRSKPAVFLTLTGNAYSALVPHFHLDSRWANVGGLTRMGPESADVARLHSLLDSKLPLFAVVLLQPEAADERGQPIDEARRAMDRSLAQYGLGLFEAPCELLRFTSGALRFGLAGGFWLCPAVRSRNALAMAPAESLPGNQIEVFRRFESNCPRFFPSGGGIDGVFDGVARRHYAATDVRIQIDAQARVYYQHLRSINPTMVGEQSQILRNEVPLPCENLVGRYRVPWKRE